MLETILFFVVIFLSNVIQEMTGFAGTVLAMPFSLTLVGEGVAKPVLNLVALLVSLIVSIRYRRSIQIPEFLFMVLFVALGFVLGYLVERIELPSHSILFSYGIIICLIAVLFFFVDFAKIPLPDWLLALVLLLAGVLHKLFISGGPLVVIYAMKKYRTQDSFRASLSAMWVMLNLVLLVSQDNAGLLNDRVWLFGLLGCIISFASVCLGMVLCKKINKKIFFKITCVLLLISGIRLLF